MSDDFMTDQMTLLEAIDRLEVKLTAAINSGLQAVNLAIANLTQMHHTARLEQEKRNAEFATSAQLHAFARDVQSQSLTLAAHDGRLSALSESLDRYSTAISGLQSQIASSQTHNADQHTTFLTTSMGWLLITSLALGGPIISVVLNHVFK